MSSTVAEIVREYLVAHGYDGLCNGNAECACEVNDLFPCESPADLCMAGFKGPCPADCGEHDWHITPGEPRSAQNPLQQFRILADALREARRVSAPDDRELLAKMEDLIESMNDDDREVANSEGWRGWPDLYDDRMGNMVESVDPDDPSTHGNPPRRPNSEGVT